MSSVPVIGKKRPLWRRTSVQVVVGVLVAVVFVVCLMFFTPIMGLKNVTVEAGDLTSPKAVKQFVLEREQGRQLPRISLSRLSEDIRAQFTKSENVSVRWSGINTLHVTVEDKVPVAAKKTANGWTRYSAKGEKIDTVSKDPGLVNITGGSPRAIQQALTVVQHVPDTKKVVSVSARTPDDISLQVKYKKSTREIRCGDASDIDKKLTIAFELLEHAEQYVDVSAPDAPVAR